MEKTISSLGDAHNRYRDALAAVLDEFHNDGSYCIQESAVLNLCEHHERFLLALKYYEADPSAGQEVALRQDTASHSRDSLVLSSKGQGDQAHMSGLLGAAAGKALADLDLKETVGTDNMPAPEEAAVHERFLSAQKSHKASHLEADPIAAEEVAPLQDTSSHSRDSLVLSSKGQADEAHMSGLLGAAAGKALADLDLKETVGTDNTPAPEEAAVHERFLSAPKSYEASQLEADPIAAEEVAPLQDTSSHSRDSSVLSSKWQGDEAHMSGLLGAAAGKALADLDLKETVGKDKPPAPEEAVVPQTAKLQVLKTRPLSCSSRTHEIFVVAPLVQN